MLRIRCVPLPHTAQTQAKSSNMREKWGGDIFFWGGNLKTSAISSTWQQNRFLYSPPKNTFLCSSLKNKWHKSNNKMKRKRLQNKDVCFEHSRFHTQLQWALNPQHDMDLRSETEGQRGGCGQVGEQGPGGWVLHPGCVHLSNRGKLHVAHHHDITHLLTKNCMDMKQSPWKCWTCYRYSS